MAGKFIVKPITRKQAKVICEDHPHAGSLPNSSKYYMALYIDGRRAGLAVWGWGIRPKDTPNKLFNGEVLDVKGYLELCRFFVYDWCPKNTASKFLAITHKIIKKHAPWVKILYTYAAGFQGLIGHIYKAAGYDYLGRKLVGDSQFVYIENIGLIHQISQWHRYGIVGPKNMRKIFSSVPVYGWFGYNFRYMFWLCDKPEKARLLQYAKFQLLPYPTENDLEIWTEDKHGNKTPVTPEFAKTIPIIKLKSNRSRGKSKDGVVPVFQAGEGGSIPTLPLKDKKKFSKLKGGK